MGYCTVIPDFQVYVTCKSFTRIFRGIITFAHVMKIAQITREINNAKARKSVAMGMAVGKHYTSNGQAELKPWGFLISVDYGIISATPHLFQFTKSLISFFLGVGKDLD